MLFSTSFTERRCPCILNICWHFLVVLLYYLSLCMYLLCNVDSNVPAVKMFTIIAKKLFASFLFFNLYSSLLGFMVEQNFPYFFQSIACARGHLSVRIYSTLTACLKVYIFSIFQALSHLTNTLLFIPYSLPCRKSGTCSQQLFSKQEFQLSRDSR